MNLLKTKSKKSEPIIINEVIDIQLGNDAFEILNDPPKLNRRPSSSKKGNENVTNDKKEIINDPKLKNNENNKKTQVNRKKSFQNFDIKFTNLNNFCNNLNENKIQKEEMTKLSTSNKSSDDYQILNEISNLDEIDKKQYLLLNQVETKINKTKKLNDILEENQFRYKQTEKEKEIDLLKSNNQKIKEHNLNKQISPKSQQKKLLREIRKNDDNEMKMKKKKIEAQVKLFHNLITNIDKKERDITKHLKSSQLDVINMSEHIEKYNEVEHIFNSVLNTQQEAQKENMQQRDQNQYVNEIQEESNEQDDDDD